MKTKNSDLKNRWNQLLQENPKLRIRDAALELAVSEAELLATRVGTAAVRLQGDWKELIRQMPKLGEVMCLTRNEAAVHERYGTFSNEIAFFGGAGHEAGQVVGADIDLRLFMSHWKFGFSVTDETEQGLRRSLQFFDAAGMAVHKIYLTSESDLSVFLELVGKYRSEDQSDSLTVIPAEKPAPDKPDEEIDLAGFHQAWLETKDTHAFFGLLKKFSVGRLQALRLAPAGYAKRVALSSTQRMLELAASKNTPILVFVGSPGCIQVHTGPVKNIKRFGNTWLNVLDEKFNFHLNEALVASAWVVRKATKDGDVTSLELFDAAGQNIALFFGKRKPGQAEDLEWRSIVALLSEVV